MRRGCGSAQKPHYRQFIEFAPYVLARPGLSKGTVPRRIKTNAKNIQKNLRLRKKIHQLPN
jgi:hypothetical protein